MNPAEIKATGLLYGKVCGVCFLIWLFGYLNISVFFVIIGAILFLTKYRNKIIRERKTHLLQHLARDEKASLLAIYKDLPSWVMFPDVERVEWLNCIIKSAWPYIVGYVVNLLETVITPMMQKDLPEKLKPFKFTKLDIGDICPKIGGVKVYTHGTKRNEVVMDLDVYYYGDCNVEMKVNFISAGVKNIELRGVMRVVLKPLVPKIPICGAISVCFLKKPTLSFNLTGIGNAMEVPLLNSAMFKIIDKIIQQRMVMPNRIVVPLMKDADSLALQYPMPQGVLRINIVGAHNLKASDTGFLKKSKSDPYVVVEVGAKTFRTKTIDNDLSPVWNEKFEAVILSKAGQEVSLKVYDEDPGSKDDFLGEATIATDSIRESQQLDVNQHLKADKEDNLGTIQCQLQWMNLSHRNEDFQYVSNLGNKETMHAGYLQCILDSCKDLPLSKLQDADLLLAGESLLTQSREAEPSARIVLTCGGVSHESKTVENSPTPVYEENFHFFVHDPRAESLTAKIVDNRTKKDIGDCKIPLKFLLAEPGMQLRRSEPYRIQNCSNPSAVLFLRLRLRALVSGPVPEMSDEEDTVEAPADKPAGAAGEDGQVNRSRSTTVSSTSSGVVEMEIQPVSLAGLGQDLPPTEETILTSAPADSSVRRRAGTGNGNTDAPTKFGRIELTLRYSSSRNCLVVVVLRCDKLVALDDDGFSDPYVKLSFVPKEICPVKKRTQYKKNDLSPTFDETFEFPINQTDLNRCMLRAEVQNHVGISLLSRKKGLGLVDIDCKGLVGVGTKTAWYNLQQATD